MIPFASGIQNGISSHMAACSIRTTNVTATIVDLGLTIGQFIHDKNYENVWKIKILLPTYIMFIVGAIGGTAMYNWKGGYVFLLIALMVFAISIFTIIRAFILMK